jgi:molybdenum-dependent DNA-binding transcriptional regulator ModE
MLMMREGSGKTLMSDNSVTTKRLQVVERADAFRNLKDDEEAEAMLLMERILGGDSILRASKTLGISYDRARRLHRRVLEQMRDYRSEMASLALEDQLQKIEWVLIKLEEGVEKGSARSAEVYLKALEQRARLLDLFPAGQQANTQVAIQVNFNGVDQPEPPVVSGRLVERRLLDDEN